MSDARPPTHFVCAVRLGQFLLALTLGCADDPQPSNDACVEFPLDTCGLLYPAEWEQVYAQTLAPTCAEGSACHVDADATGAQGGLYFDDASSTYTRLTTGNPPFVLAGDPGCSVLVRRLESSDPNIRMPPGVSPLPEGVRCSIAHWIANGAPP